MQVTASAATDVGLRRDANEDSFLIDESIGLYIVCDGMGGHAAGEVASERSIAFVADYIRERHSTIEEASLMPGGYFKVASMIEDAIQVASAKLHAMATTQSHYRGMGTTMTLLLVVDNKAVMGHVGDSRLYLLREDKIHQLSTDHTLGNEMVIFGGLAEGSREAARYSHVLTRSIGTQESVRVETLLFDLFPSDRCLICSDGLSNYFERTSVIADLIVPDDMRLATKRLIQFAIDSGGADNVTAIALSATSNGLAGDAEEVGQRLKLLKSSFLCKALSESRAMRLLNHASVVSGPAGQQLISNGKNERGIYFVRYGRVSVEMPDGSEIEIGEPHFFGETSLVKGQSVVSATIIDDAELVFISAERFESLTRRFPKLGRRLYKNLAREICRRYCTRLNETAGWMTDTLLEDDTETESKIK